MRPWGWQGVTWGERSHRDREGHRDGRWWGGGWRGAEEAWGLQGAWGWGDSRGSGGGVGIVGDSRGGVEMTVGRGGQAHWHLYLQGC